jgi:hypothetical protein
MSKFCIFFYNTHVFQARDMSRLPHFLENRLIHGDETVGLTRRPPFNPQEDSWYSFPLQAE